MDVDITPFSAVDAALLAAPAALAYAYLGMYPAIACASASVLAASVTRWYDKVSKAEEKKRIDARLFHSAIAFADAPGTGQMTALSLLDSASKFLRVCGRLDISGALGGISARMLYGERMTQAASHAADGISKEAGRWVADIASDYENSLSIGLAASNASERMRDEEAASQSMAVGGVQKYITLLTAFNTIAPSFMLFAFIGYSMLYYSDALLLAALIAFTVVVPTASQLLKIRIRGCDAA